MLFEQKSKILFNLYHNAYKILKLLKNNDLHLIFMFFEKENAFFCPKKNKKLNIKIKMLKLVIINYKSIS